MPSLEEKETNLFHGPVHFLLEILKTTKIELLCKNPRSPAPSPLAQISATGTQRLLGTFVAQHYDMPLHQVLQGIEGLGTAGRCVSVSRQDQHEWLPPCNPPSRFSFAGLLCWDGTRPPVISKCSAMELCPQPSRSYRLFE